MIKQIKNALAIAGRGKFWYLWTLIDLIPTVTVFILNFTVFSDFPRIFAVSMCLLLALGIAHVGSLLQRVANLDPELKKKLFWSEARIAIILYLNLAVHVAVASHVSTIREATRESESVRTYNNEASAYNNGIATQEAEWKDKLATRATELRNADANFEKTQQGKLDAARKLYGQTGQFRYTPPKSSGADADAIGEAPKFERRELKPIPKVSETEGEFLMGWIAWVLIVIPFLELGNAMYGGIQFKHIYTADADGDGRPDWEQRARAAGVSQRVINAAKPKGWLANLLGGDRTAKVTSKKSPQPAFDSSRASDNSLDSDEDFEAEFGDDFDVAKEVTFDSLPDHPHAGTPKVTEAVTAKVTAAVTAGKPKKVAAKTPVKVPVKVEKLAASEKPKPARRMGNRWEIHDTVLPHVPGCRWESKPNWVANLWIVGKGKGAEGYVDAIGKKDFLAYKEMFEDERFRAILARVEPKLEGREVGPDED